MSETSHLQGHGWHCSDLFFVCFERISTEYGYIHPAESRFNALNVVLNVF